MEPMEPIISRDYILKNSRRIDKQVGDLVHHDPKTSRVAFEKILKRELFLANVPFANLVENLSAEELESLDATNQQVIELFANKVLDRTEKGILEKTALQLKQNIEEARRLKEKNMDRVAAVKEGKGKERVEDEGPVRTFAEEGKQRDINIEASKTIQRINKKVTTVRNLVGQQDESLARRTLWREIANRIFRFFRLPKWISFSPEIGGVVLYKEKREVLEKANTLEIFCFTGKFSKYTAEEMLEFCPKVTTVKFSSIDKEISKDALAFLKQKGVTVEILSEKNEG